MCARTVQFSHVFPFAPQNLGLRVTVTRGLDHADAPNGYIFSIYFDGDDATDNRRFGPLVADGADPDVVPCNPVCSGCGGE